MRVLIGALRNDCWRVWAQYWSLFAKNHFSKPGFVHWGNIMSTQTYKLIELVGSSTEGTDHAIRDAIAKAALTVKHMDWYEVIESRGHIVDGKVSHYQVTIKVGFRLE
jgi:flavin-binding protein dodecin